MKGKIYILLFSVICWNSIFTCVCNFTQTSTFTEVNSEGQTSIETKSVLEENSTYEGSESVNSISLLKGISLYKDHSFYSDEQIMEIADVTGFLGLIIVYVKKRQNCRILSGNFSRVNEGENSFYLFFDTVNKNYVGISVPGSLEFSLIGKLGRITLTYNDETFLLNKFILIKPDGELIETNSPWKLNIEINSDYSKMHSIPGEFKNKNLIKLPPEDWDANLDSVYPNNIKNIEPISIMSKKNNFPKKLAIPHIAVGTSPTALFLKLNTNEYMSIFLPNNTVFFVDIDDCSIHSCNGHYYNICGGYSVYNKRWFLTNKPWEGQRVIIYKDLNKLYEMVRMKLEDLNDSTGNSEYTITNILKTPKLRNKNSCSTKCRCYRRR